jgi:hypothetical protein
MTAENDVRFDFYGLRVRVASAWPDVLDAVRRDFEWFERPGDGTDVDVTVERRVPRFDDYPRARAAFVTPRNIVYRQDDLQIVDYFGRALSIVDEARGQLVIEGEDEHLVHEATYQFVLSRAGRHFDARGLARLHALALAGPEGAVALMLPSGGGKSTLALEALRSSDVKLLSEDTPLVDRRGFLHPFPLRIGINEIDAELAPSASVHRIERMEFHPKLVLDLAAWRDRVETEPKPLRHLVLGERSLGSEARLEPLPRRAAVGALLREGVVGLGVYQGMEFVLQHGLRDLIPQAGVAATRAACCGAALRRAKVWRLTLGRDRARNWEVLWKLLS